MPTTKKGNGAMVKRYIPRAEHNIRDGARVILFNDPTKKGVVLRAGPEQSELKFPNGNVVVVCNDWFTVVDD